MNITRRRAISYMILIVLAISIIYVPVHSQAAFVTTEEAVTTLSKIGLLLGSDTGYELDRDMTRQEAVVMLVRLLGSEKNLAELESPFTDNDNWAASYVGFAYHQGYVRGYGDGTMGAGNSITARDYITFILRALGYGDSDFAWENAPEFSDKIGLTRGEYADNSRAFLREDAVLIAYTALTTKTKNGEKLIEQLLENGAVKHEELFDTKLSGYANYGKTVYTAAEIYERSSAAAFYIEFFEDEEAFIAEKASSLGSGFFVSPDGLAYLTYHEIELKPFARIYMSDGRIFEDISVLYYDGYRDVAVLKVGKTLADGTKVTNFPHLVVGNSDAVANGDIIYTISSPAGLQDCISSGLISTKLRTADDPLYPFIQFTAPISPGSSGGALLNRYGEVIGILLGSFVAGNDLNLAVPINNLRDISLPENGKTLAEVSAYDLEMNLNSTIKLSKNSVIIKMGETVTIDVTRDSPGSVALYYEIGDFTVVSCQWEGFTSKTTVPLSITGLEKGSTKVTVRYVEGYGNPDAEAEINVKVIAD